MLPMELERPWIRIISLEITNVEILLVIVLALAFAKWVFEGLPSFRLPETWLWLGLLSLAALFITSIAAPSYRNNALTAAMRTVSGIMLMLATIVIIRSKRNLVLVSSAIVVGALLAASAGLAEIVRGDELLWLDYFRNSATVAGGILRLSGPFDYSNQAAMFIEASLPLIVALLVVSWRRQRLILFGVLALGALLLVQATLLTYSRSAIAIISIIVFTAILGSLWYRRRKPEKIVWIVVIMGSAALLMVVVNVLVDPVWRLRFTTEGDVGWYRSEMHVPTKLDMVADEERLVSVTIINNGAFTWKSNGIAPVNLSVRWVHPQSENQFAGRPRWSLPRAVSPGEMESLEVLLRAPTVSGEFELIWDLVQENVTWFSSKTGQETRTEVLVTGGGSLIEAEADLLEAGELEQEWQFPAPIPGRFTLWRVASELWRARPLLGIGLDNFRNRYGEELGYELYNRTIHSNNWYIETVVSLGLVGALPFLVWLGALVIDLIRKLRTGGIWTIALATALFAYLIHGFLDYFLLFNATGLLFWILVGMWVALAYHIEGNESVGA